MYILANGRLITRDPALPYLSDGGVAVEGTKITAVGTTAEPGSAIRRRSSWMPGAASSCRGSSTPTPTATPPWPGGSPSRARTRRTFSRS